MSDFVHSENYAKSFKNKVFEIDEIYIPCRQMYPDKKKKTIRKEGLKRGIGSEMQVCVQFLISKSKKRNKKMKTAKEKIEKENNREIYFTILSNLKTETMKESLDKIAMKASVIHHDDFSYNFPNKNKLIFNHYSVKHSVKEYVRYDKEGGLIHTNTAESINNIVRSTLLRFRSVALKNLKIYLSEMIFKLYQKKTVSDLWALI
ncbi:MAG: transposase [Nanoarchaeota archaeon]|nr:transposase [Nanoarchaeota archaeon]